MGSEAFWATFQNADSVRKLLSSRAPRFCLEFRVWVRELRVKSGTTRTGSGNSRKWLKNCFADPEASRRQVI
jgi:hypothetical protein